MRYHGFAVPRACSTFAPGHLLILNSAPHMCPHSHYWGSGWILLLSATFSSKLEVMCRDERTTPCLPRLFAMSSFQLLELDPMVGKEVCDPG